VGILSAKVRIKLMNPDTGMVECAELEAYHHFYAIYRFESTGRRVLVLAAESWRYPDC
jgi:hypothetical protein